MLFPITATVVLLIANGVLATTELTETLGTLAREIVLKYFMELPVNNACLGIITEDDNEILGYLLPLDIATYQIYLSHQEFMYSKPIAAAFEEYPWEERILESINAPCLGYVIQTSNIRWMVKGFGRMYQNEKAVQRFNRTFLYLPVVTRLMSDSEFEDHINQVFRMKEMDLMPDFDIVKVVKEMHMDRSNVNTVIPGNSNHPVDDINIEIITHRYVTLTPFERVLLDVWNPRHGFIHGSDLFPYKMSNLMGRFVTSSTTNYAPFVVLDYSKQPVLFDGLEPRFVLEWSRKLNFTPGVAHNEDSYGTIYENGSGYGLLGIISEGKADVAFNAFYLWEYEHRFLDYSASHARTSVILACPRPKLLPGWKVPTLPFSYGMWKAVLLSVAICTALLYVTSLASVRFLGSGTGAKMSSLYSSWVECAFRTSGLLVLQVPSDERDWSTPRYVPMRHLVTWLILFYFVVTTAYSGGLATVLTVPSYEKPIETRQDLADRNVKWTGIYEGYLLEFRNTPDPTLIRVEKNFILDANGKEITSWVKAKVESRECCLALEQSIGGYLFMPPFVDEDMMNYMRLMKEDLYSSLTIYALRKGTPLKNHINAMVMRAKESGLFYYWEDLAVRSYMSYRTQVSVIQSRIQVDDGPIKLQLHHTVGSFYLLGFGLAVATAVFVFEKVTHKISLMNIKKSNKPEIEIRIINYRPFRQDIRPIP